MVLHALPFLLAKFLTGYVEHDFFFKKEKIF